MATCVEIWSTHPSGSGVTELCDLESRLDKIERKSEELMERCEKLTPPKENYLIGQFANELETAIVEAVMTKKTARELYIYSLSDLKQVLEDTDELENEEECNCAKKRWADFKREVEWNSRLFRCLKHIRSTYFCGVCHPNDPDFSAEKVRQAIQSPKFSYLRDEVEQLLSMYEELLTH